MTSGPIRFRYAPKENDSRYVKATFLRNTDMNQTNDNPPAFPCSSEQDHYERGGMALRDYFAANMPYDLANELVGDSVSSAAEFLGIDAKDYTPIKHWPLVVAKANYMYADAMMQARKEI